MGSYDNIIQWWIVTEIDNHQITSTGGTTIVDLTE
jgi:hypothetical protein